MKAISLTQPWATLVALGKKRIETRSWGASYRGPVAIHSSKLYPPDCRALARTSPFREALAGQWTLPLGMVLATATLVDVQKLWTRDDVMALLGQHGTLDEVSFGDYTLGRHVWILKDVRRLPYPVPARGSLGLWEYEGSPLFNDQIGTSHG